MVAILFRPQCAKQVNARSSSFAMHRHHWLSLCDLTLGAELGGGKVLKLQMIYVCGDGVVAPAKMKVPVSPWQSEDEFSWWRHQMETFSALLAVCAGNSPVPVNSPHKGQWRGALMFSLICARINDWVNNREAGDLRRYRGHYDVIVMTHPFPDQVSDEIGD